ncbi:hypothetical protein CPB83DRAFT_774834 [Crepidotus variabilis]|uniref:Uncharacterized protein n=1 Tax=Crepidotus variabilis TaxID=179855 RepID=A0A9P6E7L2_9AGAR|nr:hypothetical protein CPB83DRAFT_774834 [Crepidotus variabilis]
MRFPGTTSVLFVLGVPVLLAFSQKSASNEFLPTTFQLTSGGNENHFYRDHVTSAQVLLTSHGVSANVNRRLVVALPAGNTGALVYFLPTGNSTSLLEVELVNQTMTSIVGEDANQGIQADLRFSSNTTFGVTIIGAVRAIRDYVEGSGTMHEIFNYTLQSYNTTAVRLHRQYINATSYSSNQYMSIDFRLSIPSNSTARFEVKPSTNGSFTPPTINIVVPSLLSDTTVLSQDDGIVRVSVVTNETSLVGLDSNKLFLSPSESSTPVLKQALMDLPQDIVEQFSFLSFEDKFVAGGWRFLTYFGRDSLIALRMLMPLMTSEAIESALAAVVERANSTGALCHEETVGYYASFINIQNSRPELGNTPFYDYKMIDTDLLLLPALEHYLLDLPQGKNQSSGFLRKQASLQNGTYSEIIHRVASYNINRALPFFVADSPSPSNLIAFRPGVPVGNWRDSNQGTGYGTIPFDVNVALVPANLRAIHNLVDAGVLFMKDISVDSSFTFDGALDLAALAEKWEQETPAMFEVQVEGDTAEERLLDFVDKVGLDESLLHDGNGSSSTGNLSFYAISLMSDGTHVEVLHSDLAFNLMYGMNLSSTFLERVADALTPYPRGLLTNVGMVVANPAYDSNRTNVAVFDRAAYHGTVIWSFQQAMMAGGLARQLAFCSNSTNDTLDINPPPMPLPQWCGDWNLIERLVSAQTRLWNSIKGASANLYSEVWSYAFDNSTKSFSVADLASLSPGGTESDAIQLWSYAFLGLIAPNPSK